VREPARNEHAARQRYTRVIRASLSCITLGQWHEGPSPSSDDYRALLSNPRVIRLRRASGPDLFLEPSQLFTIVDDVRYPGEYKASTLAYVYSVRLTEAPDDEVLAWHWHPLTTPDRPAPHMHVTADIRQLGTKLSKLHIPSGRVAFEEVVRFLIADLGVTPSRDDWQEVIGEAEDRFRAFRTWA
jgi:hypothetical protein